MASHSFWHRNLWNQARKILKLEEEEEEKKWTDHIAHLKFLSPILDFFFWSHIKNIGYLEKIYDLEQLEERITAAVTTVMPDMFR